MYVGVEVVVVVINPMLALMVIKIKPKCGNQPMGKALWPASELVIITNQSPVVNTGYIAAESPLALLSGKALALLGWGLVLRTAYR